MLFQTLTLIGVFLVALSALGTVVWYAHQAAERTDRPAVRLLIRVGVSLLLGLGGLPAIQFILARMNGSLAQGFGIALLGAAVFVAIAVLLATLWAPEIGSLIFSPLEALLTGGSSAPDPVPVYSPARARRNRGDVTGALAAVREQLARFPHDWEGWRLLADLQEMDQQDVPAARATMLELVVDPRQTLEIQVAALNWLADSHQASAPPDLDAARRALEQILRLDPGSPAGHAAYQRLAHLAELEQARREVPLAVPEAHPPAGLRRRAAVPPPGPDPQREADRCLGQLERFPDDHEAREQLARLYAGDLGRP
ncbi:MAG: tetratricopeptide repeat protein, partial [Verrucomicrobiota bacterium]